ncbi:hypothetical protein [Dactylosporangium sp. NPDC000521]|uniref:hypothetical protein n=1 Tax=Dactylosporangium sp. NPDC000521 TaxID=3363975 RepID=UPI0036C1EB7D
MGVAQGRRVVVARVSLLMGPLVLMFGIAALAGVVGLTAERTEIAFLVGTIPIVVLTIIILCRRWTARMLVVATVVVAFLASTALFTLVPMAVLSARGRPTAAVVASITDVTVRRRSSTWHEWRYQLVDPDGRPIPGRLIATGPYWQIGDQVDVLVDPAARIDPREAGDEAGDIDDWSSVAFIAGPLIALAAGLAVLAAIRSTRAS